MEQWKQILIIALAWYITKTGNTWLQMEIRQAMRNITEYESLSHNLSSYGDTKISAMVAIFYQDWLTAFIVVVSWIATNQCSVSVLFNVHICHNVQFRQHIDINLVYNQGAVYWVLHKCKSGLRRASYWIRVVAVVGGVTGTTPAECEKVEGAIIGK